MATACMSVRGFLIKKTKNIFICLTNLSGRHFNKQTTAPVGYVIGSAITLYTIYKCRHAQRAFILQAKSVSYKTINSSVQ